MVGFLTKTERVEKEKRDLKTKILNLPKVDG